MKRKINLSYGDIRNNCRIYITGELGMWLRDHDINWSGEEYPDDCPCYIITSIITQEGDKFTLTYTFNGCSQYDEDLDDEKIFTQEEILDFFSNKSIEHIES